MGADGGKCSPYNKAGLDPGSTLEPAMDPFHFSPLARKPPEKGVDEVGGIFVKIQYKRLDKHYMLCYTKKELVNGPFHSLNVGERTVDWGIGVSPSPFLFCAHIKPRI